ncbi:MAG: hypothetical protein F6K11_07645 [Leptolyngbya sp. SIO3F4]|nr:hypothetical protein [Leptolyngbya sp. SIO3F4]
MFRTLPSIKTVSVLVLLTVFTWVGSGCSRKVYYSSKRVYNARKEQNKRLRKKGYSNQQYRYSPKKRTKWNKRRRVNKRKYKTGTGFPLFKGNK